MNVFTEVYEKSIELLQRSPMLADDWNKIEAGLQRLLQADGPQSDQAQALEDLRNKLRQASRQSIGQRSKAKGAEIARAAQTGKPGFQDRAALIKQLKHFYLVARKGAQSVWVVDQPKAYGQWNYDLFAGKSATELGDLLGKSGEVFGAGNRQMLSQALQQARKWSMDCEVRLGEDSAETRDAIRRWFFDGAVADRSVDAARRTLLNGFKRISAACNSGRVIFSDRPHLRASGTYDNTYASVNQGDAMPVIYIYQLFLQTGKRRKLDGKIPKMWLCALTIIHELSHKLQRTEDIRYDQDGLKPSASFPSSDAIRNADSWAYFCGDLLGYVPRSAVEEALQ